MGDFKLPDIDWNINGQAIYYNDYSLCGELINTINDCSLYQTVKKPTFRNNDNYLNILDLIFFNSFYKIMNFYHHEPFLNSKRGHDVISFNFLVKW